MHQRWDMKQAAEITREAALLVEAWNAQNIDAWQTALRHMPARHPEAERQPVVEGPGCHH